MRYQKNVLVSEVHQPLLPINGIYLLKNMGTRRA